MTKKPANKTIASEICEKQVETWLYDNPDFFSNHLDLLENLFIPHPSGGAISLVSKQLDLFRDKNRKLANQLENLIQIAKENDALFRRMQQFTLALLDTKNAEETVAAVTTILQDCFLADFVALKVIADPEKNETGISDFFISPDNEQISGFKKVVASGKAKCGETDTIEAHILFGEFAAEALSSAIIPLDLGDYRGILGIGSLEHDRFKPNMGNLFLDHIGELVGKKLALQLDL